MNDFNPFEESDFEWQRAHRERNPEALEQRQRELAQMGRVKQPGEWLNRRYRREYIERQSANEDALTEQRRVLALERRDRLWDAPVHEPRIESLMDEERNERERG